MRILIGWVCLVLALLTGCEDREVTGWELEHVTSVKEFKTPECALVNPAYGTVYVSNIFAVTRTTIGALDGNGFISQLEPGGKIRERQYLKGTEDLPVHGPSGMCLFNGYLHFNDRNGHKRRALQPDAKTEVVEIEGVEGLNDAAAGTDCVYATSTKQGIIYRIDAAGKASVFQKLPGVNGIKSWRGKLFAVTTAKDKSDLYELDPKGVKPPKPFGLAPKFAGIDGIEVLPDGTFLITDCHGHKVYTIAPDRKTVKLVVEGLEYPADLGIDFARNLVYIPQFFRGTVEVYRLKPQYE